ncbi:opsin-3-like [Lethenteron reissneri]|uniref:opsin-3-like n=1 Tax=Lethenteron reissneri TaxID=7753 RepID=UPI002AB60C36|nr:opsin-3-like [Lethenteron reissneri]
MQTVVNNATRSLSAPVQGPGMQSPKQDSLHFAAGDTGLKATPDSAQGNASALGGTFLLHGGDLSEGSTAFSAATFRLLAGVVGTIGVAGFVNNLLVVALFLGFKRLQTPTNLLLVNISLSDLLVSVFGNTLTLVACVRRRWVWGDGGCVWDGFSNSLFGIVSISTLTALSYERYARLIKAQVLDFSWAWRAVTYTWLYSAAWTGAPLLGWSRYVLEKHGLGCSIDWASSNPPDAAFVLFFFLGCLAAPLLVMGFCYGRIALAITQFRYLHVAQVQTAGRMAQTLRGEFRVARLALLVVAAFLLCWMPYAVVALLTAAGHGDLISPATSVIPSFFAKSSIAYNPILYVFLNKRFRRCLQVLVLPKRKPRRRASSLAEHNARWGFPLAHHVGNSSAAAAATAQSVGGDRPRKRVTFSSSSVVFIIFPDDAVQRRAQDGAESERF